MDENIVQVVEDDGTVSYEVLEEDIETVTEENTVPDSQSSEPDTVSESVPETQTDTSVLTETETETVTLADIHTQLQTLNGTLFALLALIVFMYCAGLIKNGIRSMRSWNKF